MEADFLASSDGQLASKAAAGDDSAFNELVSRYRTRVYHLALSKVRSRETALDLAQDAFVQAYVSLNTLRESEKFGAWLTGITANICKMHLRRRSEEPMPTEVIDRMSVRWNPLDVDAAAARDVLNRLPNGTRSAAILYFVEQMTMAETAEFLGVSLHAVKARIRDARTRLQKEMIDVVKQAAKQAKPGEEFEIGLKHRLELARWYRELGVTIYNGDSIMLALDKLRQGDYSAAVKNATAKLMSAVQSGSTVSQALRDLPDLTTPETVSLVTVGEMGGTLERALDTLADCIEARQVLRDVELSYWCRVLGTMLASGVAILSALNAAEQVAQSAELKATTWEIVEVVKGRGSMRPVIEKHADLFSPLALAAIVVGEYSGTLDYTLQWLAGELAADVCSRLSPLEELPDCRAQIAEAIAEPALRFLSDEAASLRVGAATLLARFGVKEAAPQIARLLESDGPELRRTALCSLAALGSVAEPNAILHMLSDPDASVRRAAVRAVVVLRLAGAADAIAGVIADPDQHTASAAIQALEAMGEINVLTGWAIENMRSHVDIVRVRAVHIIRHRGTTEATDALISALDDAVFSVSVIAALRLADFGRIESLPKLVDVMDSPCHYSVKRDVAEALAKLGYPSAAPHIRRALENGTLPPNYAWTADKLEGKQVT